MDDTSQPPAPPVEDGSEGDDEVGTPMLPARTSLSLIENVAEPDESGELEFEMGPIQAIHRLEMGPGSKGRQVPYVKYGFAVIMSPKMNLLSGDGKRLAIMVPLPPSGLMKLADLNRLANRMWREEAQKGATTG